eukprot:m.238257 g.238257  ORF g.238257 m.238257 type:complete len:350 (+) comp17114_c6_seq1:219-1268(+)
MYSNDFLMGTGPFAYQKPLNRSAFKVQRQEPTTGYELRDSFYYLPHDLYFDSNGVCKDLDGTFYDMFDWVFSSLTKYTGKKTIQNRTCDQWELVVPDATLTLCADGNVPVLQSVFSSTSMTTSITIFHTDFTPNPPGLNDTFFQPPKECFEPPTLCPGPEDTAVIDAYIFHPRNTTGDIVNQDVADLLGDVLFICTDALSNHTQEDEYAYVSYYKLEVVTKWGQYEQCNGYPGVCLGSHGAAVGREASFGIKDMGGQCANNTDTGSWLSLPIAGACKDDEPMSIANNCTWRIVERVKTIDGHCLLSTQGMLDSCLAEAHIPFAKTVDIMTKAFYFDDETVGGCPNVVPN